jgi:FixJ family two-component response regulator
MRSEASTVFVVDDDPSLLRSVERLLQTAGYHAETFSTAESFLAAKVATRGACLILDVNLPGLNGLELQRKLAERGSHLPVIFIAGHGSIPMTVRAMKAGAVTFLPKPFEEPELIGQVEKALAQSREEARKWAELTSLRQRHATLTARESEVLLQVVSGKLNKQIAFALQIGETTVKVHRGRVMRKMQAQSVADLVIMAERLSLSPAQDPRK